MELREIFYNDKHGRVLVVSTVDPLTGVRWYLGLPFLDVLGYKTRLCRLSRCVDRRDLRHSQTFVGVPHEVTKRYGRSNILFVNARGLVRFMIQSRKFGRHSMILFLRYVLFELYNDQPGIELCNWYLQTCHDPVPSLLSRGASLSKSNPPSTSSKLTRKNCTLTNGSHESSIINESVDDGCIKENVSHCSAVSGDDDPDVYKSYVYDGECKQIDETVQQTIQQMEQDNPVNDQLIDGPNNRQSVEKNTERSLDDLLDELFNQESNTESIESEAGSTIVSSMPTEEMEIKEEPIYLSSHEEANARNRIEMNSFLSERSVSNQQRDELSSTSSIFEQNDR